MSKIDEMRSGFETAYIDGAVASGSTYRPRFVSNNYKKGKKVLSSIEDELLTCDRQPSYTGAFLGNVPYQRDRRRSVGLYPGCV